MSRKTFSVRDSPITLRCQHVDLVLKVKLLLTKVIAEGHAAFFGNPVL